MTAAESDLRRRFRLRPAVAGARIWAEGNRTMRIIAIIAAVLAVAAGPAFAQAAPDEARQNHLDLAERYLVLTQGGDLVKQMRGQLEESYDASGMPSEQRAWLIESVSATLAEVMDATVREFRDDVADSFTVQELESAIAFYESPVGRSVVRKQVDMTMDMQETMMTLLMPRMSGLMEKFCLRFDCSALGEAAQKESR
jgi:hypothetical protein